MLDQLHLHNLVQETGPGRYSFHDLLREHARSTAVRTESTQSSTSAVDRLLDHYLGTAIKAIDAGYPYTAGRRPPSTAGSPEEFPDRSQALAWLDVELDNLLAGIATARAAGRHEHIISMSATLHRHLLSRGHHVEARRLHEEARRSAVAAGEPKGEALALIHLGAIHRRLNRHDDGARAHQGALALAQAENLPVIAVDALVGLAAIHRLRGELAAATDACERALRLARDANDDTGELEALVYLGHLAQLVSDTNRARQYFSHAFPLAQRLGHHPLEVDARVGLATVHIAIDRPVATVHLKRALELSRAEGLRVGELASLLGLAECARLSGEFDVASSAYLEVVAISLALDAANWEYEGRQGLGRLHHALGRGEEAIACHRAALDIAADTGQTLDICRAHDGLAVAYASTGRTDRACVHWRQALSILRNLGVEHTDDPETTATSIEQRLKQHARADPEVTLESGSGARGAQHHYPTVRSTPSGESCEVE
jgi:tetratricopeptide (TPR) repeat protein